jgi:hypothetical protein
MPQNGHFFARSCRIYCHHYVARGTDTTILMLQVLPPFRCQGEMMRNDAEPQQLGQLGYGG